MLMVGRLLGGVSTSLLFSVFEAWLIKAHSDADLPKQCLPKSFSWAAFGNSAVAIFAGLIAEKIASAGPLTQVTGNIYRGGYLNPFDLSILALVSCAVGAHFLWEENYGARSDDNENNGHSNEGPNRWYTSLQNAFTTTWRNKEILLCGIISSLFEGSMYIFVFMWTPLLKQLNKDAEDPPFGLIFATFMVCCMTGSSLFSIVVEKFPVEKLGIVIFGVGSVAFVIVALEINDTTAFLGMNLFEVCVGMYFPIMGTMKGGIVPEDKRAAIYNLYRIPLNLIVVISLLTHLEAQTASMLNATMLAIATVLQIILSNQRVGGIRSSPTNVRSSTSEQELSKMLGEEKELLAEPV